MKYYRIKFAFHRFRSSSFIYLNLTLFENLNENVMNKFMHVLSLALADKQLTFESL